ncbi:hypothetical protein FB451DRAFT_1170278 [Mycena latifolia]|nr:hypothetical protein FB451DRAFT_1170278 [Mycena latifolia]
MTPSVVFRARNPGIAGMYLQCKSRKSSAVQVELRVGGRNQQPKGSAGSAAPAPCAVWVFKPASSVTLLNYVYPAQTGSRIRPFGESAVSTIKAFVLPWSVRLSSSSLPAIQPLQVRQRDSKVPHAAVATSVSPAPTMIVIISEAGRDDTDSPIIVYKIGGSETPAQVHLCERLAAAAS